MAPTLLSRAALAVRFNNNNCNNDNINNDGNNNGCFDDNWGNWGRWILLVIVIVFFVFVALSFSCINSRRRRRAGLHPRYGTGWAAGKTPMGHNAPQYTNYDNGGAAPAYNAPPPVYGQQTGNTFNSNDGYYGQQTGIELQQPQQAHQQPPYQEPAGYAPPTGPPPANAKN